MKFEFIEYNWAVQCPLVNERPVTELRTRAGLVRRITRTLFLEEIVANPDILAELEETDDAFGESSDAESLESFFDTISYGSQENANKKSWDDEVAQGSD